MEKSKRKFNDIFTRADGKIMIAGERVTLRDVLNTILLFAMFFFYCFTFFIPKFYGRTEAYVGVFVFAILALMFIVNVNPIKQIKNKDIEFIAFALLTILVAVNILLVDSGYGCFFVAVNFAGIFYLSNVVKFAKWQIWLFSFAYCAMLLYWFAFVYTWMFADYSSFAMNTNTAATFTMFSMLVAFIFFDLLMENHKYIAGFLVTLALVKSFQISLYHRSRGAFIMLGVYCLLRFIVPRKWWEKKSFFNIMFFLGTIGSLLFVAFYVWLGTTGVNFRMPFFYKNVFSGREAIWYEFWTLFKEKPLTGIGTNVTITSFFEFNVHNAMYNILVIHGVLVFAITLFLMYRRLNQCRRNISAYPVALAAMTAVMSVFIESYTDVDLIWANYSLNLFILMLTMHYRGRES